MRAQSPQHAVGPIKGRNIGIGRAYRSIVGGDETALIRHKRPIGSEYRNDFRNGETVERVDIDAIALNAMPIEEVPEHVFKSRVTVEQRAIEVEQNRFERLLARCELNRHGHGRACRALEKYLGLKQAMSTRSIGSPSTR